MAGSWIAHEFDFAGFSQGIEIALGRPFRAMEVGCDHWGIESVSYTHLVSS